MDIKKLWKSSGVIFQKDENGLIELTPKAAMIGLVIVGILFLAVSAWAR